jgi:hypothetical protein
VKIGQKSFIVLVSSDSTVVEHIFHNPMVEGSSPATGFKRQNGKKWAVLASSDSTVVAYSAQHPMVEGSSPATAPGNR